MFGHNVQKKNLPENLPAEKNIRRCTAPEIHQPDPKLRRKTYQQIRLSNLQVHAGRFRLRRIAPGGVLQSMDSGTLFGCLLGMVECSHAEMHLQSLSCCWWEGQGLLRTLPDNMFQTKL